MTGYQGGLNPRGSRASLPGLFDNSADILVVTARKGGPLASSGPRTGILLNVLQLTGHPTAEEPTCESSYGSNVANSKNIWNNMDVHH